MKDYLNYINDNYPIRRTKQEKEIFRNYILDELKQYKYNSYIETLDKRHNNIIIGDISQAKVIFTAHYDTPGSSIIPNLMLPRNAFLGKLYHLGFPILLSILSLIIAYIISFYIDIDTSFTVVLYLLIYLGSFYLLTRCFKNKHNKNDNTSGVATIMSLIQNTTSNDVAYILFDDEEKGLLGSKAFNKLHKQELNDKLIINFDCVGVGKNVLFILKENAEKHKLINNLKENNKSNNDYEVLFYPFEGSFSNSDYKNFNCGIGVMTCNKKNNIYYTSKIHTNKDTEANINNIDFIINNMIKFIEEAL